MNKVYCRYCGKQIDADAMFCPHCGKKQETVNQQLSKNNGLYKVFKWIFGIIRSIIRAPYDIFKIIMRPLKDKGGRHRISRVFGKILLVVVSIVVFSFFAIGGYYLAKQDVNNSGEGNGGGIPLQPLTKKPIATNHDYLKKIAEKYDSYCPITGMWMNSVICTKVGMVGDTIVFYLEAQNDGFIDIERELKADMTHFKLMTISDDYHTKGSNLFKNVKNYGGGVSYYIKTHGKHIVKMKITTLDIIDFETRYKLDRIAFMRDILKYSLELVHNIYPSQINETTTAIDSKIEGNNVVHVYEIDENILSMNEAMGLMIDMKEETMESYRESVLLNSDESTMLRSLIAANIGIIYRFIGNKTKQRTEFFISVAEINEML